MKTTFISVGLIGSILTCTPVFASTYRVTEVSDGDTIKVIGVGDHLSKKVRLACIDAPEADQPQGKLSTITLASFIPVGTEVKLNIVDTDKYGRTVAEVILNNVIVNQSMLKKGQAVVYHEYLSNCPDAQGYTQAEKNAKQEKIGFWNDAAFISPEDWRNGTRPVVSKPTPSRTMTRTTTSNSTGYVSGTCKHLRSLGLSQFTPGDANYTPNRDRDGDGIACE